MTFRLFIATLFGALIPLAMGAYTPPKPSWSGYHDNNCVWARTSTSLGGPSADSSCTFTQVTNQNFGTVASELSGSDKLPGITFTPKKAGRYFMCAITSMINTNAGVDLTGSLTDGTQIVAQRAQAFGGAGNVQPFTFCGIVVLAAQAYTFHINIAASASTVTIAPTGALGRSIDWSIFMID